MTHKTTPASTVLSLSAIAMLITGAVLNAGPLTPPVGPVAPTAKPLAEIEPRIAINATNTPGDNDATPSLFKITAPGAYYLTGNITGEVGKHGIEIVASNVTIDLNGFALVGVPGTLDGVGATVINITNIEVRNGSIRSWGGDGVDLSSLTVAVCVVRDVRSSGNGARGISTGSGSTLIRCAAYDNGTFGIAAGQGSTVTECAAFANAGTGINASTGCTVTACSAYDNGANGIATAAGCTVTGSSANFNAADGISVGFGSTINACTAYSNAGNGITADSGSTINGCTARANTRNGKRVNFACSVLFNTCASNGNGTGDGAGILATGSDNRIEGNTCATSDRGIDVDGSGNIIIRNVCAGNTTNWSIAAGNHYGPIIDRTAVAAPPAVSGNSATEALGSTHPNANFTY